MNIKRIHF